VFGQVDDEGETVERVFIDLAHRVVEEVGAEQEGK